MQGATALWSCSIQRLSMRIVLNYCHVRASNLRELGAGGYVNYHAVPNVLSLTDPSRLRPVNEATSSVHVDKFVTSVKRASSPDLPGRLHRAAVGLGRRSATYKKIAPGGWSAGSWRWSAKYCLRGSSAMGQRVSTRVVADSTASDRILHPQPLSTALWTKFRKCRERSYSRCRSSDCRDLSVQVSRLFAIGRSDDRARWADGRCTHR
jgi:hypothetical protein